VIRASHESRLSASRSGPGDFLEHIAEIGDVLEIPEGTVKSRMAERASRMVPIRRRIGPGPRK
jgi:hypothetical protein